MDGVLEDLETRQMGQEAHTPRKIYSQKMQHVCKIQGDHKIGELFGIEAFLVPTLQSTFVGAAEGPGSLLL